MCNVCNTNQIVSTYGCGRSTNYCGGVGTGWNYGCQRLCKDCCGNIYVNNRMSCCHTCGCGCTPCYGGNTNDGNDTITDNGNGGGTGGFTCITFCGNRGGLTQTTTNGVLTPEEYYARQYGLGTGCGRHIGCGCHG